MEETAGKKLVGRRGKRRDADSAPLINNWQTDVILNKEPGWRYDFFLESEVPFKLHPTRVQVVDWDTGETEVHDIPGWKVVQRETGPEEAAGWRPDEGKPIDTVLRHGNGVCSHVCMRLPEDKWIILQRAQEHRADAYEERLRGGSVQDINGAGDVRRGDNTDRVRPGEIRLKERFTYEGA